ncbi:ankyrin repeat-containing domain, PGG domain protein [Artemisia annua]|uniref:Ankyrin repeat-containing domain, PGG domain protein n=1 Tax=Artemisia annua TaxID=35608 RepID=A0A2U1PV39_ARTAN|nr:ankyrin repeat-containing domain, PGG domain protein [Artemisia annua]
MSDLTISINHKRTNDAELYKALSEGDDAKVCEICRELPDGPFHILTIHSDSVLYIASYYKRNNLVLLLISQLSQDQYDKLTSKNEAGNTILHATATNNKTVGAAAEMLRLAPSLLTMTDKLGETALFHAARYGKTKIFNFLEEQVRNYLTQENLRTFLLKDNTSTILHVAIHSENFELAFKIAETYPILIDVRDGDGMTALQLLACKPSAFVSGFKDNLIKSLIYKFTHSSLEKGKSRVPIVKEIQKQMLRSKSAKKLATLLIESDASWEATETISNHQYNRLRPFLENPSKEVSLEIVINKPDSPLFLATKLGCTDIVKKILKAYPQAVEQIDEEGCGILHVAIKYRRLKIFKYVIKMKHPLMRLRGKIDKQGNSILHMVGLKVRDHKTEGDIRSPALILRDDLLLFERVRKVCTKLATLQVNNDGRTAEQLFIENNEQLRIDAKQWMRSTAEHCTIIAVLIATVAFAAAYTVPGGPDQETGYPLLKSSSYFVIFALADALSLAFSMTSVITFLSILTSSFRLSDFRNNLHNKLLLGLTLLILSVSFMMVAFAATLILTISSPHWHWTNIILYTLSFLPVTMFMFSYVRLYTMLIRTLVASLYNNIALLLPTCDVTVKSTQLNH